MSSSDQTEPTPAEEPVETVPEAEAEKRKRARLLRLKAAVILPLLFGGAALVYFLMIDGILADQLVAQARAHAGQNADAQVGNVRFSIFGPKLKVEDYQIWQTLPDGTHHEVLFLREANLDIEFWPLLERRLVVSDVSATEIRVQEPWSPPEEDQAGEPDVPTDTNQPELNEYLKQIKDILNSEELKDLQDWIEKLQEYTKDKQEPIPEDAPEKTEDAEPVLGPAERAWYVREALAREEATPRVVVKNASLAELAFAWADESGATFAHRVTDLKLSAQSVSSDPIAYKLPMEFIAAGNLNGDVDRRVELGLTVRFDPDDLVTLEQVDGKAGIKSVNISNLVDTAVFGDTLRDAQISLTHFASSHGDNSGRTQLQLAGIIQPPELGSPVKASFALWFGGFRAEGGMSSMMPSGISVQVEDFPLEPMLNLAGGSPIPLANKQATISFGTVDANGRYGTPESALSWHNGINVHMRLQVKGLSFADPEGDLAGLPGTFLVRGLNKVIDGMGGLDVVVGFQGSKDNIALDLEKPGLRAFVDAVVNALTLTAPELKSMVDLPFEVNSDTTFGLASMNADGSVRDPQLGLDGEARHDLNDLRVGLNLRDITIAPKPGQTTIIGLPANDFCRGFNGFMQSLGPDGLAVRTRIMNAEGAFSPALESPGTRGLVDAMAGVLSYTGQQLNTSFDLPLTVSPGAAIRCESVGEDGLVRTMSSPGADTDNFDNFRIRLRASDFTVSPKAGQANVLGIPANQFCASFNTFVQAQGANGIAMDWRVFNDAGSFAPQLKQPGTRGLLDGVVNTLKYNGSQMNSTFDLPFKLADDASIEPRSIEPDGKTRTLTGPDSGSDTLENMTIAVVLKNGLAEAKPGTKTILGLPADYFTFAWNKLQASYGPAGMPMRIQLFNSRGEFSPALNQPDEQALLKQMGTMVGINDFAKNFTDLPKRFEKEWPAFQKEGLKVAKDIAEGKWKPPETPKELPKEVPDIPKLPWGK